MNWCIETFTEGEIPILQSLIAKFGLTLPAPFSREADVLVWQDDAWLTRLLQSLPWTHFIELIRLGDPRKRNRKHCAIAGQYAN
jgi:hypothetical protein